MDAGTQRGRTGVAGEQELKRQAGTRAKGTNKMAYGQVKGAHKPASEQQPARQQQLVFLSPSSSQNLPADRRPLVQSSLSLLSVGGDLSPSD